MQRHRFLFDYIGAGAVLIKELNAAAQAAKCLFSQPFIFRQLGDMKLTRGVIVIEIHDRRSRTAHSGLGDLSESFRRINGSNKLSGDCRRYTGNTAHNQPFAEHCTLAVGKVCRRYLVIRGFILSRRVYVGDSGQQLSVPVYVYRNSLNRIDDLACIYIDQHDVAVLTHNLDNKALGGCKAKLCLCLNINLYNPFCALLSDLGDTTALDVFSEKHTEIRGLHRIAVLALREADARRLAAARCKQLDVARSCVNLY